MTLVKTPLNTEEVKLSDNEFYWKQILPNKNIDYHGKILRFGERDYLESIVSGFKEKALGEQTAFQLADDENSHDNNIDLRNQNYDPQRYRGEIVDVEIREDGLYGKLRPTSDGNKTLTDNPKLAVSAMLEENYTSKANGKTYPVVMRHVLGTLNPHIKGMKNWEKAEISLSEESDKNEEVIDLISTENKEDEKDKETVAVPKEEWDNLQAYIKELKSEDEALENLLNDPSYNGDDVETEDKTPETVGLSDTDKKRFRDMENKLAASDFDRRADSWRREGVPNSIIELARPALSTGSSNVITLSSGETKDPKVIISAMLDELKGTIDLSEQKSHSQSQEEVDSEEASKKDFVAYMNSIGENSTSLGSMI